MAWFQMCFISVILIFMSHQSFVPKVPKECEELRVCEDVENYPDEYVNNIVKQLEDKGEMWKFDKSDAKLINVYSKSETKTAKEYKSLCKSVMRDYIPRAGRNSEGVWQFIINTSDRRLQPIRMELCANDAVDHQCGDGIKMYFNTGYNASCTQKFSYRYTLGLNHNGSLVEIRQSFPSCCQCLASHGPQNWEFL